MPLLSVLTTSYNREEYLAEAIESVLASTFTDFEYIIVDDQSTEKIFNIAKRYEKVDSRVKVYVNETRLGDYGNRSRAASLATGKYIKYLDSDDFMYPYGLQVMVEAMEKFPEAGFGLSALQNPKFPYPLMVAPEEIYLEHFNGYGHFSRAPGSAIIKREAFERVGGFSGKRFVSDFELWLKLANHYPMVKFSNSLCWDRIHGNQERTKEEKVENLRRKLLKEALSNADCPLTDVQKTEILKIMRRRRIKEKALNTLSRFL